MNKICVVVFIILSTSIFSFAQSLNQFGNCINFSASLRQAQADKVEPVTLSLSKRSTELFSERKSLKFYLPTGWEAVNKKKIFTVVGSWGAIYGGALVGLNVLWYKNYPHEGFHFFNDSKEWLQMDKVGHVYTNYFETRLTASALRWSGVSQKKAAFYGSITGLAFQTTLEMMDAYSSNWGFSVTDMTANVAGAGLFLLQELTWKEQRICLKFSSTPKNYNGPHIAIYSEYERRIELFGNNFWEEALKNYNTQTYWLSFNIQSLSQLNKFPKWLNIDLGYSADGLYGGFENKWKVGSMVLDYTSIPRVREFFLSPDIDFTRIKTKSHFLKAVFEVINIIKVPAPAFMLNSEGKLRGYFLYF